MLLKNKTAVISGSNRGIGKSIVEIFSKNGANIFACARNIDNDFIKYLNDLENKFNNKIFPIQLEFKSKESINQATKKILGQQTSIDILINNAGVIHTALFQMTSRKSFEDIFETNYFAQTSFTQQIIKPMIKNKTGSIIYISSSSAIDGNVGRSAYSASKAAMIAEAKVLSKELGNHNIRVNTIAPGLTETDMMRDNTQESVINETLSKISLKRIAEPVEIANTALFLSSDISSYITGQVIRVDGGM